MNENEQEDCVQKQKDDTSTGSGEAVPTSEHITKRAVLTDADPLPLSRPLASPQVTQIPLRCTLSSVSIHLSLFFFLLLAESPSKRCWEGVREGRREGRWVGVGVGEGGGSLAARPIASARFVMSQDLAGLASTSSSRGQREWETQRMSAAAFHSLFEWVKLNSFFFFLLKDIPKSGHTPHRHHTQRSHL